LTLGHQFFGDDDRDFTPRRFFRPRGSIPVPTLRGLDSGFRGEGESEFFQNFYSFVIFLPLHFFDPRIPVGHGRETSNRIGVKNFRNVVSVLEKPKQVIRPTKTLFELVVDRPNNSLLAVEEGRVGHRGDKLPHSLKKVNTYRSGKISSSWLASSDIPFGVFLVFHPLPNPLSVT
jgi:hypothetical protein